MADDSGSKAAACERCYRRKARCDRSRPSCASCTKARKACLYPSRTGPIRRQDMERLEQSLLALKEENEGLRHEVTRLQQSSPANKSQNHTVITESAGNEEVTDQVSYLSLSAGGERQFLGSTSGLLLANLLQKSLQPISKVCSGAASRSGITPLLPGPSRNAPSYLATASQLPPRDLAKDLLTAYCNHYHICYPFLDTRMLHGCLEAIYEDESFYTNHAIESCFIDMILAIGTAQVYKFDWQVLPDAETHFERAMARIGPILAKGGIHLLQMVLLICQYRMGSSSYDTSASLWHLIGVAARMCFELGLHKESTYTISERTPREGQIEERQHNELKRRCFWCVVAMDRIASFTLGRPLAIQSEDVDTELPRILGFCAHSDATNPPLEDTERHNLQIFNHIICYRMICGKMLTCLHRRTRVGQRAQVDYDTIRNGLLYELNEWNKDTDELTLIDPDHSSRNVRTTSSFRSREWYDLLYHNGILMLFRPSPNLSDTLHNSKALELLHNSAQRSIHHYAHLHQTRKINYSWITLHAVFIAGLSYIYALRCHYQNRLHPSTIGIFRAQLQATPTINQVVNDTRACSNVLVAVSERWSTAKNCSQVFDRLSDAILTDVVDAQTRTTAPAYHTAPDPITSSDHHMGGHGDTASLSDFGLMAIDPIFQDCLEDLQNATSDHYQTDTITQLWQSWMLDLPG